MPDLDPHSFSRGCHLQNEATLGILFYKGRLLGTSNNEGPVNHDWSHHIRTEKGAFLKQDDFPLKVLLE